MRPAQIFISYRRDDTAGYARAIHEELARHFGADRVFIDVDDIGAGQAFADVIAHAVGDSEVLLVLIGRRWLGEREGQPPRLADEGDLVQREIATALESGMRVVPLLLDGAAMPDAARLPMSLKALAARNALEVSATRYGADMERLVGSLRGLLGETARAPPAPTRRRWPWALAGALLLAAAAAAIWSARKLPTDTAVAAHAARAPVNGRWQAEVTYDWPNARYTERFEFGGAAGDLHGSASYLKVPRGLLEGSVGPQGVAFVTQSRVIVGDATASSVHRYRGRLSGDEIRFVMQTEGGLSAHVAVEFTARRVAEP